MTQTYFDVDESTECMVEWDSPLGTFFGQVYKIDKDGERVPAEDGGTILHVGNEPGKQIRTVDELERRLCPVTALPPDVRKELFEIEIN